MKMRMILKSLFLIISRDDAQSLAEYALIVSLILLLAVAALTLFGVNVSALFLNFANAF